MKTRYKFINFVEAAEIPNTWHCRNNRVGDLLGQVWFYRPWKQWVFEPFGSGVFSSDCLADIQRFMSQLTRPSSGEKGGDDDKDTC